MIDVRGISKIDMARYTETVWAIKVFSVRLERQREFSRRQLSCGNVKGFSETTKEIRLLEEFIAELKREASLA